ncbi:MAG: hypothetical protein ACR2NR_02435 [Solirubrobacteraceae bacterium]
MRLRHVAIGLLVAIMAALTTVPRLALAKHTASASASATATPTATASSSAASGGAPVTPPTGANPFSGGVTPLGPVSTASSTTPTIINNSTTTSGTSSLSGGSAIGIAVGAFIVLGGISYFIWRDARRRAPVAARSGGEDSSERNRPGSKAPPKARKLSSAERKRRKRGRAKR